MTVSSSYAAHASAPLTPADAADIPLHVDDLVQFTLCTGDRQRWGRVVAFSSNGRVLCVESWNGHWNWAFDHECSLYMASAAVDVCGVDWRTICKEATRREFERAGESFEG